MTILEQLPDRLDALAVQISQFRDEVRVEFSAVRREIQAGDEETRRSLREEIRAGDEETRRVLREEIRAIDGSLREVIQGTASALEKKIQAGNEESQRFMRVLYEDMVLRLATIQEGRDSGRPKP